MGRVRRIYHHVDLWEDIKHGMYASIPSHTHEVSAPIIKAAAEVLTNCEALYQAMEHVAFNWEFAADFNLSNVSINRQAWLGQAACCFEVGANEGQTKAAWRTLTEDQQDCANGVADKIIAEWEESKGWRDYAKDLFGN